jgi:hypothetical protein
MKRQLVVWLEWIVMTVVALWLVAGLTILAGPFIAALVVGPALVVYALGARRPGWRRAWSAALLFIAAFLLVRFLAVVAAVVVAVVLLVRSRREA